MRRPLLMEPLRAALNAAVKQRRISYNPCAGIELEPEEPPEAQQREDRAMTIRVRSASVGRRTSGPATVKSATLGESYQVRLGGAGGARTHDRRIMRTTARRSGCATCTDTTQPCHRWR